jgi:hypothetical protein
VPILSLIAIVVEEFWVKPVEQAEAEQKRTDIALPAPLEEELEPAREEAPPLRPAS